MNKNIFLKVFAIAIFTFFAISSFAVDVVNLKNGDVFRGSILEQKMNEYVQLRMLDGNEKRIEWKKIAKISKESDPVPAPPSSRETQTASNASMTLKKVGQAVFGATYGVTLGYGIAVGANGVLFIPVVGPFLNLQYTSGSDSTMSVLSGTLQLAGLIMWGVGALNENTTKYGLLLPQINDQSASLTYSLNF